MAASYYFSQNPALAAFLPEKFAFAKPIFAFGLVAFGFLGMGPVTIAVDSYGPVTDNAQSVYELSQIEARKDIKGEIKRDFGFDADFENAKYQLEKGDGAGNTFKATAKPVLIGTAVVGATTMVFGIIMLLQNMYDIQLASKLPGPFKPVIDALSIVQPEIILGLIMGGAVIYWFTGASCQAVVTGAYSAVVYINEPLGHHGLAEGQQGSRPHLHRLCPEGDVEHFHRRVLLCLGAALLQCLLLHRLPHRHRFLRFVSSHFHGQCRRRVGQRQENRRSGSP
jgi:K(+)-stimulated pyrophosphate-energized sodium pump